MSDVLNRRYAAAEDAGMFELLDGGSARPFVDAADAAVDYDAGFEDLMATTQGFPTRIQFADAVRAALGRDT